MKIQFDHQIFQIQKFGGISRYHFELYRKFKESQEVHLSVKHSNNEYVGFMDVCAEAYETPYEQFFKGMNFRGKKRLYTYLGKNHKYVDHNVMNCNHSIASLNYFKPDIFHPTYYDDYFLDTISVPYVLTVHDMISERFPEYYSVYDKTNEKKKHLCEKASRVIAISKKTKDDLIEFYDIPDSKIDVIHHGTSLEYSSSIDSIADTLPSRYILFVGHRWNYKNFRFFFESIVSILQKDKELNLICTGPAFDKYERFLFQRFGLEDQVKHYFFKDDEELSSLYHYAQCFVFPSQYEGFGIPILEAFSCECPVLLSHASCFPEVAEDAALYFDPKSVTEIRVALESILYNKGQREKLIEKGNQRVKNFSWEKTASQTMETYKKAIEQ